MTANHSIAKKCSGEDVGETFHMNPNLYWNAWISSEMNHDVQGSRTNYCLVLPFDWDTGNNIYVDPMNPEDSWEIIPEK